jgi:hypothetical protein
MSTPPELPVRPRQAKAAREGQGDEPRWNSRLCSVLALLALALAKTPLAVLALPATIALGVAGFVTIGGDKVARLLAWLWAGLALLAFLVVLGLLAMLLADPPVVR